MVTRNGYVQLVKFVTKVQFETLNHNAKLHKWKCATKEDMQKYLKRHKDTTRLPVQSAVPNGEDGFLCGIVVNDKDHVLYTTLERAVYENLCSFPVR